MLQAVVSIHDFHAEPKLNQSIRRLRIKLSDRPEEDASARFAEVNSFLHSARLRGGNDNVVLAHSVEREVSENVLVHCVAGASRSVCFVAAYLMTVTNLDYAGAIAFVASKRSGANPNIGFRMQLMKFANQVSVRRRNCDLEEVALAGLGV